MKLSYEAGQNAGGGADGSNGETNFFKRGKSKTMNRLAVPNTSWPLLNWLIT